MAYFNKDIKQILESNDLEPTFDNVSNIINSPLGKALYLKNIQVKLNLRKLRLLIWEVYLI